MGGELTANADGFLVGIAGSAAADALVGAYRLEKQLGRGGMAAVYLARDERLDRLVALKIMAPALPLMRRSGNGSFESHVQRRR